MYHNNKECNQALVRLMDTLCTWERNSGRRSLLILIPKEQDEPLLIVQDGKPLPSTLEANIRSIFNLAINERDGVAEESEEERQERINDDEELHKRGLDSKKTMGV